MQDSSSASASHNTVRKLVLENLEELREVAGKRMAMENEDHSLQASALVNELTIKLLNTKRKLKVVDKDHFMAIASRIMKRILVDWARHKKAHKAGGKQVKREFDPDRVGRDDFVMETLILHEELEFLNQEDPLAAQVLELVVEGHSVQQAADQLNISKSTAYGLWHFAKAWITHRLNEQTS